MVSHMDIHKVHFLLADSCHRDASSAVMTWYNVESKGICV